MLDAIGQSRRKCRNVVCFVTDNLSVDKYRRLWPSTMKCFANCNPRRAKELHTNYAIFISAGYLGNQGSPTNKLAERDSKWTTFDVTKFGSRHLLDSGREQAAVLYISYRLTIVENLWGQGETFELLKRRYGFR